MSKPKKDPNSGFIGDKVYVPSGTLFALLHCVRLWDELESRE